MPSLQLTGLATSLMCPISTSEERWTGACAVCVCCVVCTLGYGMSLEIVDI